MEFPLFLLPFSTRFVAVGKSRSGHSILTAAVGWMLGLRGTHDGAMAYRTRGRHPQLWPPTDPPDPPPGTARSASLPHPWLLMDRAWPGNTGEVLG